MKGPNYDIGLGVSGVSRLSTQVEICYIFVISSSIQSHVFMKNTLSISIRNGIASFWCNMGQCL